MTYFAEVIDGIVTKVIVSNQDFINNLPNSDNWIQTYYEDEDNPRKNYAGIGMEYDNTRDAFIHPKPFPSWVLNEDSCLWFAPIPYPNDTDYLYDWNEELQQWDQGQSLI